MSAKPFFITGLPRSRTAWLSVLMTTDDTICFHEPSRDIANLDDLGKKFESEQHRYVGVSDSGLGFLASDILERFKPRTLIVERPIQEVEASLDAMGFPASNYCEALKAELDLVKDGPLVMRVPFQLLGDKRVAMRIFWHLMPGIPFDEERFEALSWMNIQTDNKMTLQYAMRNPSKINELMNNAFKKIRLRDAR